MENTGGRIFGRTAGAAVLACRLVVPSGATVIHTTAITQRPAGACVLSAADTEQTSVKADGYVYLDCDGSGTAIVADVTRLMPKASGAGFAIAAVGATAVPCAIARESTTSATGRILVQLTPGLPALG